MTANVSRARRAVGERTRQKVVDAVASGAVTYAQLEDALEMSLVTIKRHLTDSGLTRKADRQRLAGVS